MPLRVKTKVNVKVWKDTKGTDKLLDLDDTAAEVVLDAPQEANVGSGVVAAAGGTFTIPLGKVDTPTGLFLRTTGDVDLVLNGGAQTLAVKRPAKAASAVKADYAHFFFTGTLTGAVVTNNGASDVEVVYAVWGDNVA